MPALINAKTVAERLGVSDKAIYALARARLIPSVRVGRSVRFEPEVIEQFVRAGGRSYEGYERRESRSDHPVL